MVAAPSGPGVGLVAGPEYPKELAAYVVDRAGAPIPTTVAGVTP